MFHRSAFVIVTALAGISSLFVGSSVQAMGLPLKPDTTATIAFSLGTTLPDRTIVTITGQAL